MRRQLQAALVAAAAGAAPAFAEEGWYGRADAGYGAGGGLETPVEIGPAPQFGGDRALDEGWMLSGAIGHAFESGLRVEAEIAHRANDVESGGGVAPGAEARATTLLFNVYYDFNREGAIQPYFGVGLGGAQVDAAAFNTAILPSDLVGFDDEDFVLAYQLAAGVGFDLSERLTLDVSYRYLAAPDLEFSGVGLLGAQRTFDADYDHHGAFAGVRWRFSGY